MAVAVIDTGVLVGMADIDDEHHDIAVEIVRGIDHGDLPTGQVTNYITPKPSIGIIPGNATRRPLRRTSG